MVFEPHRAEKFKPTLIYSELCQLNIANLNRESAINSFLFSCYTLPPPLQVTHLSLIHTPICNFGAPAVDFELPGIDGQSWSRSACMGPRGLLVMFICNHCPYVQAINSKLVRDTTALMQLGIGCVAIMPNDVTAYPQDDLHHMQTVAREQGYPFPYLLDENQQVARAFGAICTPDFFGYNDRLELQYRGRLDATGATGSADDVRPELFLAMQAVAESGKGPELQVPSMGCSIKWRAE